MLLLETGFLTGAGVIPYIHINKVSNTLVNLDTCLTRHESQLFNVNVHHTSFRRLNELMEDLEDIIPQSTFKVVNRKITGVYLQSKKTNQFSYDHHRGILQYRIHAEKRPGAWQLKHEGTLWEVLDRELPYEVSATRLAKSGRRPYIFIPEYETIEDFWTTKTKTETTQFEVVVEANKASEAEEIQEKVDNVLSFANLTIRNRKFFGIRWLGDSLQEVKQNLWQASIRYEMFLEKAL